MLFQCEIEGKAQNLGLFSLFCRCLYFVFAHLPVRIFANIILYVAIISLLLHFISYYIEKHPKKIESLIQDYLLINIKFSSIKIHYNLLKPNIKLSNLTIIQPNSKNSLINSSTKKNLHFKSASISIHLLKSLVFFKPFIEYINLDGFNSTISHKRDGSYSLGSIKLFTNESADQSIPIWLFRIKSFSLSNTNLIINDQEIGFKEYHLKNIHFKFTNLNQWTHRLSVSVENQNNNSDLSPILFDKFLFTSEFKGSIYKLNEWTGKFYLNLKNLHYSNQLQFVKIINKHLNQILPNKLKIKLLKGSFSGQFWGDFSQSSISQIIADTQFNHLILKKSEQILKIKQLNSILKLKKNTHFLRSAQLNLAKDNSLIQNWLVSLYQLQMTTQLKEKKTSTVYLPYLNINILKTKSQVKIESYIDKLTLQDWDKITQFIGGDIALAYSDMALKGALNKVRAILEFNNQGLNNFRIHALLDRVSSHAWQQIPSFKNLSAQLWASNEYGLINIHSTDLKLFLKPLVRKQWQFDHFTSQISWQSIGSQWWVNAENKQLKNKHFNIYGNAQLWVNKTTTGKLSSPLLLINSYFDHTDPSYTANYLPSQVMSKSLVNWLDKAFVSVKVPDGGILFRGRIEQFPFIHYNGLLDIDFHAQNLLLDYQDNWPMLKNIYADIQFTHSGMFVEVNNVELYNSHSHNAEIKINDYSTGNIQINAKVISNANDSFKFLQATQIANKKLLQQVKIEGDLNLDISLYIPEKEDIKAKVTANFDQLSFSPQWLQPLKVSRIKGNVTVNNGNISSSILSGTLAQERFSAEIKSIANQGKGKSKQTQITLNSKISTKVLKEAKIIPKSLGKIVNNINGSSHVNAIITLTYDDGLIKPQISLNSNLKGISSTLPAPFNKTSEQGKVLKINLFSQPQQTIKVSYANIISYCSKRNEKQPALNKTHIHFMGKNCQIPNIPQLNLTGKIDLSNLKQWQSLLVNAQTSQQSVDIKSIHFDLEELLLPNSIFDASKDKSIKENDKKDEFNFYSINGKIQKVMIGEQNMGNFSIKSRSELDQIIFDQIKLKSEHVEINLNGSTFDKNSKPITQLQGSINISNTGKVLKKLDLFSALNQANSHFKGYIKWHGSITDFSAKQLFGKIKFNVSEGRFEKIEPGLGRIIGLINLSDLSNKLSSNFKDQSVQGFKFEKIKGNILFNQNNIYTRDIILSSKIAEITTNGVIDLNNKNCKYLVTVIPDISSGLPYAGLALGGPAGAALGLFGQEILGSEFNKLYQYQYSLNGLCSEPQISTSKIKIPSLLNNQVIEKNSF